MNEIDLAGKTKFHELNHATIYLKSKVYMNLWALELGVNIHKCENYTAYSQTIHHMFKQKKKNNNFTEEPRGANLSLIDKRKLCIHMCVYIYWKSNTVAIQFFLFFYRKITVTTNPTNVLPNSSDQLCWTYVIPKTKVGTKIYLDVKVLDNNLLQVLVFPFTQDMRKKTKCVLLQRLSTIKPTNWYITRYKTLKIKATRDLESKTNGS